MSFLIIANLLILAGNIIYDSEGVEVFNFGKYKGQRVVDVFKKDIGYFGWIQNADFRDIRRKYSLLFN